MGRVVLHAINKQQQPNSLTWYKNDINASYNNLTSAVKDEIRDALLAEQGYVCAYCMKRIKAEAMKIEHWACRHNNPEQQLDYSNLLACCEGNEGQTPDKHTCDTKKGSLRLKYSPANPAHNINARISYQKNGRISSNEADFDQQINDVLNLNEPRLVSNRRAALNAVQQQLAKKRGTRNKASIQALLQNILTAPQRNDKNLDYFGVMVGYLRTKL